MPIGNVALRTTFTQKERGLQNLVRRSPPAFAVPGYNPCNTTWDEVRVLVVGAGGIGCEVLHALALSGFTDLTVIDMDTIELSNLNRQFLFRVADIGRSKAAVAAAFVERRCPGLHVRAVCGRVEEQEDAFYAQFHAVILCLDSIAARRWVNRRMAALAEWSLVETEGRLERRVAAAVPLMDTGTEGYEGCCRVVLLGGTACVECTIELYPPRQTVPLCTLENVPRAPEHCVLYAQLKLWDEHHPDVELDVDDASHISWLRDTAQRRKETFGILGPIIDEAFVIGVVKNVLPAVGFTNAMVAGQAVLELMKILTGVAPAMQSFAYYNGAAECGGLTSYVTSLAPNPSCPVCAPRRVVRLRANMSPLEVYCAMDEQLGCRTFESCRNTCKEEVDATLRLCFQGGEVYLMYRRSNPMRRSISGTTMEEIFTAAGHAAAMQFWRTDNNVFALERNDADGNIMAEAILC